MSYSGYDIEDAIIMNKASIDRGFGRSLYMKKYSVTCKRDVGKEKIDKPVGIRAEDSPKYQHIEDDGLCAPGDRISPSKYWAIKYFQKETAPELGMRSE
jgi:DNA-directed RNA polymerase III subunit RPC2